MARRKSVDSVTLDFIWSRVEKTNGCWLWLGARMGRDGYGHMRVKHSNRTIHRLVWELTNGPIPEGKFILHKCDTRPCCRPDHLFIGTARDNVRDMVAKGRSVGQAHPERLLRGDAHYSRVHPELLARGERHGSKIHPEKLARGEEHYRSKLTTESVLEIRKLRAETPISLNDLAAKFQVRKSTINSVIQRKTWKHI